MLRRRFNDLGAGNPYAVDLTGWKLSKGIDFTFKPGTTEVVNTLAESLEVSDDHLTYTFKLKEGIQFHGGYGEVTAEDVKSSYERFIDPVRIAGSGIPQQMADLIRIVPFNNLAAIERVLEAHPGQVAGMILEPMMMNAGIIPPAPGYLQGLVEPHR